MPINLDTVNRLYGTSMTSLELPKFFAAAAEKRSIKTSEDVVISAVGRELYEKFFRGYTRKMWGMDPSELDASVTARVPVRSNRDDRYFTDTYQAMPKLGYTRMFERMLSHPNIKVLLNADYREVARSIPFEQMVYTGPVDEFFENRLGKLPYRSLEFHHETRPVRRFQAVGTINFPNEHPYTRVTEFKHLTGQEHEQTSIVYEIPRADGDPYYPVPRPANNALYEQYKAMASNVPNVHFVGRLATYKYYNMDQVVAQALALFSRLRDREKPPVNGTREDAHESGIARAVGGN
jgi:UDP-galactopyranose mutase